MGNCSFGMSASGMIARGMVTCGLWWSDQFFRTLAQSIYQRTVLKDEHHGIVNLWDPTKLLTSSFYF